MAMLIVLKLSDIMLYIVMLRAVMLIVVLPSVFVLRIVILSDVIKSVFMLRMEHRVLEHQCRKIAVLSCHRFLISSGV
jgi:hypothetical protein